MVRLRPCYGVMVLMLLGSPGLSADEPEGSVSEETASYWQARIAKKAAAAQKDAELEPAYQPRLPSCSLLEARQARVASIGPAHRTVVVVSSQSVSLPVAAGEAAVEPNLATRCKAQDLQTGEEFVFFQPGGLLDNGTVHARCGMPTSCLPGQFYEVSLGYDAQGQAWVASDSDVANVTSLFDGTCVIEGGSQ